jgi:hypothetical protein
MPQNGTLMKSNYKILLTIDGVVNLILGSILLFFPVGLLEVLGLPPTNTYFYVSILGAVIFGIGIALFLELYGVQAHVRGLGLSGAIAINLCGGGVLLVWLIAVPLDIPLRGKIILWLVAVIVLAIGLLEIATKSWKYKE